MNIDVKKNQMAAIVLLSIANVFAGCGTGIQSTAGSLGSSCQDTSECSGQNLCSENICVAPGTGATQTTNAAPKVEDLQLEVVWNTPTEGALIAKDDDSSTLGFRIETEPNQGSLVLSSSEATMFTYTPASGYSGPDSFTFYANDGSADSNLGTVTIVVASENAPTGLAANRIADNNIVLSWQNNANDETEIRIERKTNSAAAFVDIATVPAQSDSYTDTSAVANGAYVYRVIAVRPMGDTGPSNEVSVLTTPEAPAALTAVQNSAASVELSWNDQADFETGYRIERYDGSVTVTATIEGDSTSYIDSGLRIGVAYTWTVVAVAGDVDSATMQYGYTFESTNGPTWSLNDTGVDFCKTTSSSPSACPVSGATYFGQDAQYGTNTLIFTDNGDGTATDNVTNLVWQREDNNTTYSKTGAESYCAGLSLGGQDDWRLPNRHELLSIADLGQNTPAIDATIFPGTSGLYWTSTYRANTGTFSAFSIDSDDGRIVYSSTGSGWVRQARCVRG